MISSVVDPATAWVLIGLIGLTLFLTGVFLLTVPVYEEASNSDLSGDEGSKDG